MQAPIYRHPETGEELTAKQWGKKLGITQNAFILRRRIHGADNPKTFKVGRGYSDNHGTREWQLLDDSKATEKPLKPLAIGRWEQGLESIKREPKLIKKADPAPKELIVLEVAQKIKQPWRSGEVAKSIGKSRKWVGTVAARLVKKGLLRRVKVGVYSV
jgi:hypothetical protein